MNSIRVAGHLQREDKPRILTGRNSRKFASSILPRVVTPSLQLNLSPLHRNFRTCRTRDKCFSTGPFDNTRRLDLWPLPTVLTNGDFCGGSPCRSKYDCSCSLAQKTGQTRCPISIYNLAIQTFRGSCDVMSYSDDCESHEVPRATQSQRLVLGRSLGAEQRALFHRLGVGNCCGNFFQVA